MSCRNRNSACPSCGGKKKAGTTTFSVDLGFGVVMVRRVPAQVCSQCGADWIADDAAARGTHNNSTPAVVCNIRR